MMRSFFMLGLMSVFLCVFNAHVSPVLAQGDIWGGLIERLGKEGFNRDYLLAIYRHKEVRFEPRTMPKKLLHRERPFDYKKFLRPKRIKRAVDFLNRNKTLFEKVERIYGVPAEIKAALLLIETDLGNYTGNYLVINTLSSMAISSDVDRIAPWLPKEILQDPRELSYYRKKAKRKSRWAFMELKSFLIYCKKNHIDPVTVKGSPFGAFGICQFMPSSAIRYGVDFDHDGKVDLFDLDDALASMANYLKQNGWHGTISRKEAFNCLLTYNRSRPYANTILEVAEKIGQMTN